ncbi:tyrosine-type recombinase/integrase [Chryseobacterium aquaticum]|uniref:Integrase n=1 Tax=Chryseobacterium aquaticum subsp. greenlandense TaxID=345663 RepID=A0A124F284_9FLAO|nr:tyrosine-type recombinase/integrase [Chryseobacterium aquaticum]KUJ54014.1 hypothetical protein AR686_17660 [Chryseobacterium aquaticum subsp. greenlandense]
MKFKDAIPLFINYKKDYVGASTMTSYQSVYRNDLVPYFGEMQEITKQEVMNYIRLKSTQGISKSTIKNHIVALKTFFSWGNRSEIFVTKPFKVTYTNGFAEKVEIHPFSADDAKKFVKYCEDNFTFDNFILYIAIFTGLRAGELCGLKWSDVDVKRGVLNVDKIVTRVCNMKSDAEELAILKELGVQKISKKSTEIIIKTPKTPNSIREIPLAPQLLHRFKLLQKISQPENYIATNSIKPTEPTQIRNRLNNLLNSANLPIIRLHDLRHTFATRCISAGIDVKTVSVMLGHSTVMTTLKTYMHTDDDQKIAAFKKLGKKMSW